MLLNLLSDANDTASRTRASIARDLALLMASLAQVICAAVDDESPLLMKCQCYSF